MKVLVTGASGEVGRPLVARLVAAGCHVRALYRRPDASVPNGVERIGGDVTEPASLRPAMAGVDAVVHAAAHLGDGGRDVHRRVNAVGTHAVLAAAAEAGVRRIVHLSTVAVHGRKGRDAVVGPDDGWDPEPELRDDYAWSKIGAERWARCFVDEARLPIAVLRPGIVWGGTRAFLGRVVRPGPRGTLVVLGTPGMRLPVVHVADVVEAIWRTLALPRLPRRPLHVVGPDAPTQAAWLAARAAGRTPVFVPVAPLLARLAARGVPARWRALAYRLAWATQSVRYDRAPLAEALGWQPEIGIAGPAVAAAHGAAPRGAFALADGA